MGNGYKLSTLMFTSSFYIIHMNCKLCNVLFPYHFHVNVTVFTQVG